MVSNTNAHILSRKSKGLFNKRIKSSSASNNFLDPSLDYLDHKIRVKFSGSYLKQDKVTFSLRKYLDLLKNYLLQQRHF